MARLRSYLVRVGDIPVGSLLDVIEALASHIMTRAYLKPKQSVWVAREENISRLTLLIPLKMVL